MPILTDTRTDPPEYEPAEVCPFECSHTECIDRVLNAWADAITPLVAPF